jgi:hypothetical protein
MTTAQYLVLVGAIYVSHATHKAFSGIMGCLFLIAAAASDLGWI